MKKNNVAGLITLLIIAVFPASVRAAVVTHLWEESAGGVTLTLSGSFDVTGWNSGGGYLSIGGNARVTNSADPFFDRTYQMIDIVGGPSGYLTRSPNGQFIISPFGSVPSGTSSFGTFVSGTFRGEIIIDPGNPHQVTANVQTSDIVNGVYTVDGVYRFDNTSLATMFGTGLAEWSSGAKIATIGTNEIWFTTIQIPEPSTTTLLMGAAGAFLALARRRPRKM